MAGLEHHPDTMPMPDNCRSAASAKAVQSLASCWVPPGFATKSSCRVSSGHYCHRLRRFSAFPDGWWGWRSCRDAQEQFGGWLAALFVSRRFSPGLVPARCTAGPRCASALPAGEVPAGPPPLQPGAVFTARRRSRPAGRRRDRREFPPFPRARARRNRP